MYANEADDGWSSEEEEMRGKQQFGAIRSATFVDSSGTGYANNVSTSLHLQPERVRLEQLL